MKKFLVLAVIAAFVMMPLASFARTAISDSDLDTVTAQQGVSIEFNNLSVSGVTLNTQSWGDTDGFSGATGAGYYGQANISLSGNVVALTGGFNMDIGTTGIGTNAVTKVMIGLPTITIGGVGGLNVDSIYKLDSIKTLDSNVQALGVSYMNGLRATIAGGLTIYAH